MTLNQAIAKFIAFKRWGTSAGTSKGYLLTLRQFGVFMRNCEIEAVKIEDVMAWFTLMEEGGWDRNSFLPKTMALRKFFEYLRNNEYQVLNPILIPIIKQEYKIARVATEESYEKLLSTIAQGRKKDPRNVRNLALLGIIHDSGARVGEICSISLEYFNPEERYAIIKTEKSQGRRPHRQIFWSERTNAWVLEWVEKRSQYAFIRCNNLFVNLKHQKQGQPMTNKGVGNVLRNLSVRAGIETVNAHSFRHAVGHRLVAKGAPASVVTAVLGHSSLASSAQYTRLNDQETRENWERYLN